MACRAARAASVTGTASEPRLAISAPTSSDPAAGVREWVMDDGRNSY